MTVRRYALALALLLSPIVTLSSPASAATPSGCSTDALLAGGVTPRDGAYELVVLNPSDRPCVLSGVPTLTARSSDRAYVIRSASGRSSTAHVFPARAALTLTVRLTRSGCAVTDSAELEMGATSVEFPTARLDVCRNARVALEGVRLAVAH